MREPVHHSVPCPSLHSAARAGAACSATCPRVAPSTEPRASRRRARAIPAHAPGTLPHEAPPLAGRAAGRPKSDARAADAGRESLPPQAAISGEDRVVDGSTNGELAPRVASARGAPPGKRRRSRPASFRERQPWPTPLFFVWRASQGGGCGIRHGVDRMHSSRPDSEKESVRSRRGGRDRACALSRERRGRPPWRRRPEPLNQRLADGDDVAASVWNRTSSRS